ncbi:DUF3618 domain-containing protein (plasmid) [Streptosporangium sp. CA-135522]|uniref:DUF3618 domain-containing protein n=1 Tax=Streptosporangium sp. CA-135522 TaxID=3240072 RepID=UPI003D8C2EC6
MMTTSGPSHGAFGSTKAGPPQGSEQAGSAEQLRADIAQTREHLGETVEALAAKADIKARAKARAKGKTEQVKAHLTARAHHTGDHVRTMATEFTTKARQIAAKDTMPAVRRGAAAATVLGGAVAVTAWLRRRNAPPADHLAARGAGRSAQRSAGAPCRHVIGGHARGARRNNRRDRLVHAHLAAPPPAPPAGRGGVRRDGPALQAAVPAVWRAGRSDRQCAVQAGVEGLCGRGRCP